MDKLHRHVLHYKLFACSMSTKVVKIIHFVGKERVMNLKKSNRRLFIRFVDDLEDI